MTREQAKICKNILKYKRVNKILRRSKLNDYDDICSILNYVHFETTDDDDFVIFLPTKLIEEYERYQRETFYPRISLLISICALIVSIIALIR